MYQLQNDFAQEHSVGQVNLGQRKSGRSSGSIPFVPY